MCAAEAETPLAADRLIVFVKAPRPGLVKTRIAEVLGAEAAAAIYRRLAECVLANLAGLREVELRFAPDDALPEIAPWLCPGWRANPQGGGDLGVRLERAFADAFAAGARRVVVIGSDCPEVRTADIRDAWQALAGAGVALGPAQDGGYWLIGLAQPQPRLFTDLPWSTADVFRQTVERARALGLRVARLRQLADVDTAADWQAFQAGLGPTASADGKVTAGRS